MKKRREKKENIMEMMTKNLITIIYDKININEKRMEKNEKLNRYIISCKLWF